MGLERWIPRTMILAAILGPPGAAAAAPDVVLSGEVRGVDHQSYRDLPFLVPAGTRRITVSFDYDRSGVTIDLGLADPLRFRGWSGGNKTTFTVAETDATPSYLPGPLPPGEWRLVLGVPHADAAVISRFRAEIFLAGAAAQAVPLSPAPARRGLGWYRGDLHTHSGHSDGTCAASSGSRVPCPVYRTVAAAAARGLDFLALTDHNTRSHHQPLAELQAAFDDVVLMPGVELTTFRGHAGVIGGMGELDFRAAATDMNAALASAARAGSLVVIAHPGLPSDRRCMGCGWTAETDYALVDAVEVVNGGTLRVTRGEVNGPLSGVPFWEELLDVGRRITAVAGSDNHDPDLEEASGVGRPATVVEARELSQPALLEGIRAGRVFVDVEGSGNRLLDLTARAGAASARMGETLTVPAGARVAVTVATAQVPGAQVSLIRSGGAVTSRATGTAASARSEFVLPPLSGAGWVRAEVSTPAGRTLLLSNPIYLNGPEG